MRQINCALMAAPRRRRSQLIEILGDETVVYDLETHRANCLNREAAVVFAACDGIRTSGQIHQEVARSLNTPVSIEYVDLALDRLSRGGLLDGAPTLPSTVRRDLLQRLAAVAILPVVTTVLAPSAAQAQSCRPKMAACTINAQCCSNMCMMGTCG